MNTNELKVAIYARVSTDQQAQGGTILSQVEELKKRIETDNVSLRNLFAFSTMATADPI